MRKSTLVLVLSLLSCLLFAVESTYAQSIGNGGSLIKKGIEMPIKGTVEEVWREWLLSFDKCNLEVSGIQFPKKGEPDVLLRYYLINAYRHLCIGDFDKVEDLLEDELTKHDQRITKRKKRERLYFDQGYFKAKSKLVEALLDSIDLAAQKEFDQRLNRQLEKIGNKVEMSFPEANEQALSNIPLDIPNCFDSNLEFSLIGKGGIEFKLTTILCSEGAFESEGYAAGQIGYGPYYKNLSNWLYNSLIASYCEYNPACLDSIAISVEGHADAIPIDIRLSYPANSFELPQDYPYEFRTTATRFVNRQLPRILKDKVESNEDLALGRAAVAQQRFQSLTNKPIDLKAIAHDYIGKEFRKVVITVKAKGLFNAEIEDLKDVFFRKIELRKKYINSFLKRP